MYRYLDLFVCKINHGTHSIIYSGLYDENIDFLKFRIVFNVHSVN